MSEQNETEKVDELVARQTDGLVAHVVIRDTEAHRELVELCAKWRRKNPHSLYIDGEQSLFSWRASS